MSQLIPLSIAAPAFMGLNKQFGAALIGTEWATEALNCIVDEQGRLAARQGWISLTDEVEPGEDIIQISEHRPVVGERTIIFTTNSKIYAFQGNQAVDITGSLSFSSGNWKFQNLNGRIFGFQSGYQPIVWDGTGDFALLDGSPSTPTGSDVLSAYGRLWALDSSGTELRYSDLLIPEEWDDGGSGAIDLKSVWVMGMDRAVAIEAFNGHLVIFGENSVLIYAEAMIPEEMYLVEHIQWIGCVARDSVQHTGEDLVFLSRDGVKSLGRLVMEKSLPVQDETFNIRDYIVNLTRVANKNSLRSAYYPELGFYLLSYPAPDRVICVDHRTRTETGSRRITEWTEISPTAMYYTNGILYIARNGKLGIHEGYLDDGETYWINYQSGWTKISDQDSTIILKRIRNIVDTQSGVNFSFKWAFDYKESYRYINYQVSVGTLSEWGISEFGIGEFSGAPVYFDKAVPAQGTGKVIKFGAEVEIQGYPFAIHEFTLHVKSGRISS